MTAAWIIDAVRTPIGRYAGALSAVRADDLGAIPMAALHDGESFLVERYALGLTPGLANPGRRFGLADLPLPGLLQSVTMELATTARTMAQPTPRGHGRRRPASSTNSASLSTEPLLLTRSTKAMVSSSTPNTSRPRTRSTNPVARQRAGAAFGEAMGSRTKQLKKPFANTL